MRLTRPVPMPAIRSRRCKVAEVWIANGADRRAIAAAVPAHEGATDAGGCGVMSVGGFTCTRPKSHIGLHIAHGEPGEAVSIFDRGEGEGEAS